MLWKLTEQKKAAEESASDLDGGVVTEVMDGKVVYFAALRFFFYAGC